MAEHEEMVKALSAPDGKAIARSERREGGRRVAPITTQAVQDIFELRLLLEPAAARRAAGRVDIGLLKTLSGGPYEGADVGKDLQFLRDNKNFHVEIARASGNVRLTRFLA